MIRVFFSKGIRTLTGFIVEKGHAKDGGEIGPGQEEHTEERERLHGGAVPLARVRYLLLLAGDLEVEPRLAFPAGVV